MSLTSIKSQNSTKSKSNLKTKSRIKSKLSTKSKRTTKHAQLQSYELAHESITGFTLIELLLVAVILSLLLSIAVPSYTKYIKQDQQRVAQQQGLYIAHQLQLWQARNLTYLGFNHTELQLNEDLKYVIQLMDATGELPLTHTKAKAQGWRMLILPNPEKLKLANSYYLDSTGQRCVFIYSSAMPKIADIDHCQNTW